jgi:dTDP-4-dehydrorhamnose 3,5-epimerase-like enzyme
LTKANTIRDLLIEPLASTNDGTDSILTMLSFNDHLLRRFGQLDLVRKDPGHLTQLRMRSVADEIWVLIEGKVRCLCRDLRQGSPSEGTEVQYEISAPTRLLIPFGVAFGWQALRQPALLLRCATHQDGDHQDDQTIALEAGG